MDIIHHVLDTMGACGYDMGAQVNVWGPYMPEVLVQSNGYECSRCGHQWVPRGESKPLTCPSCHSPYWDRPRRLVAEKKAEYKAGQ